MKMHKGWDQRSLQTLECNGRRRVGVDHALSPSNDDDDPVNRPRTIPQTEDRKHGLSTWLQAYGLHDLAVLRCPELIVAGELAGGY